TAYTGRDDSMSPSRESAAKRGPSPQPRSASLSGPAGSQRARSGGSCSMSKWIAVSVYRSLTRARLRAPGSAVAGLAFTAADLEPATRALERAVPPLHIRTAAHADLDDHPHRLCAHRFTLDLQEDGYDDPFRRRGRVVRQKPAKPRTAVRVRSAPLRSRGSLRFLRGSLVFDPSGNRMHTIRACPNFPAVRSPSRSPTSRTRPSCSSRRDTVTPRG